MMVILARLVLSSTALGRLPLIRTTFACRQPGASLCHSRSTARNEEENFPGAESRAFLLASHLANQGMDDLDEVLCNPEWRGSAALRAYNSFVYPKTEGAYHNAEKPGRALTIAQSICFYVRERRAQESDWLRNHDRALAEVRSARHPLTIVLDNVRSAANVGNILRAAEAGRIERVYHCGITPSPPDRKLLKTALGSAEYVPHERSGSTLRVVKALQEQGIPVWACETTEISADLNTAELPRPLALIFGNELIGVDVQVLEQCDNIVQIPTFGVKNSLNGEASLPWHTHKYASTSAY
jgi:23S rRNA (guanosine2251-2'-O)-methyltransferase